MISSKHVLKLPDHWQNGRNDCQGVLDEVRMIDFEAPIMPVDTVHKFDYKDPDSDITKTVLRIDGGSSSRRSELSPDLIHEAVQNVRSGKWSLLLLGDAAGRNKQFRYFLRVEWVEDGLEATRVGGYLIQWDRPVFPDKAHTPCYRGEVEFTPLEHMEWRRVRLV